MTDGDLPPAPETLRLPAPFFPPPSPKDREWEEMCQEPWIKFSLAPCSRRGWGVGRLCFTQTANFGMGAAIVPTVGIAGLGAGPGLSVPPKRGVKLGSNEAQLQLEHLGGDALGAEGRRFIHPASLRFIVIHLVTIQNYKGTEKRDLQLVLTHNPCVSCRRAAPIYPDPCKHLRPLPSGSPTGRVSGKLHSLNELGIHLTTGPEKVTK